MQESGDDALLVEAILGGEVEYVDPAKAAIGRFADQSFDGVSNAGIGRVTQRREQRL